MLWWQWLLTFGIPAAAVGLGLLLGKFYSSILDKNFKWWSFPTWASRNDKPCINFEQFLDMYQVNPDKWYFHYDYFNKRGTLCYYVNNESTPLFWKTYRDQRRFNKWLKRREKEQALKESNKILTQVLTDVQKDVQKEIERRQKEFDKEIARINKEKEQHQKTYRELLKGIQQTSSASVTAYSLANSTATFYTHYAPTVIHMKSSELRKVRNGQSLFFINNMACTYFEADCGIPYLRDEQGNIWEVKIIDDDV